MKSTDEITCETTNKYTLITVVNWEEYQTFEEILTVKTTNNMTVERQASDKQATSERQQRKNEKNNKNEKNIYVADAHDVDATKRVDKKPWDELSGKFF